MSFSKGQSRPAHPPAAPILTTIGAPAGVLSDPTSAREVCRAIAAGDQAALALLYEAWADPAFRLALTITRRDEATCLDIVQSAFVRIIRSHTRLGRIQDHDELRRWMVRVVHSAALDHLRTEHRVRRRERAAAVHDAPRRQADAEMISVLTSAIARLDAEDRALLRLRFGDASGTGSLRQVAAALDSTVGAAHGRIRRALQRLADHL